MKPGFYFDETWRQNYYFFIGWKPEDYIAYCEKEFQYYLDERLFDEIDGKCVEMVNGKTQKHIILIFTQPKKNKLSQHTIIAHECLHATNMTLRKCGYKVDLENDESQAYLFTNVFRQALSQIETSGRGKRATAK